MGHQPRSTPFPAASVSLHLDRVLDCGSVPPCGSLFFCLTRCVNVAHWKIQFNKACRFDPKGFKKKIEHCKARRFVFLGLERHER